MDFQEPYSSRIKLHMKAGREDNSSGDSTPFSEMSTPKTLNTPINRSSVPLLKEEDPLAMITPEEIIRKKQQ